MNFENEVFGLARVYCIGLLIQQSLVQPMTSGFYQKPSMQCFPQDFIKMLTIEFGTVKALSPCANLPFPNVNIKFVSIFIFDMHCCYHENYFLRDKHSIYIGHFI